MLNIAVVLMVALTVASLILYLKKVNIVQLMVLSVVCVISVYILMSGILFWMDTFSIQKAVMGTIIVQAISVFILWLKRSRGMIEWEFRSYIIPIIVIFLTLPLVWGKYGFYGMGQDEGVYQNHAILLMYGRNDVQLDFEEYKSLSTDEEKSYYKQELHEALTGYYFYDTSLQTTNEENKISDVSGTIHGIPTFAAVLALWGRLFGLTHMVDIQTLFFICGIILAYMICEKLKLKRAVKLLVTVVLSISPIVLWVAKSSLTEMFLMVLMELYIYGIVNYADRRKSWFAVMAVVVFSFYHFTIYTVLPMFIGIHWILFIVSRKKIYIYQNLVINLGALMGICMSCIVAPAYTIGGIIDGKRTGNFRPLYELIPWINENNVLTVVCVACAVTMIISILLLCFRNIRFTLPEKFKVILVWGLRVILVGSLGMILWNIVKAKSDDNSWRTVIGQSTFVGFGMVTGGIILAVLCILWLVKTRVLIENIENMAIAAMFIYCILIYSVKLRPMVAYYYYFGRYLVPFVPIALICAGILINKVHGSYVYGQLILSVVLLIPYLPFFYHASDDTQLSRETLEEIQRVIDKDSTVIMSSETGRYLYLPVRTMTGASVYFQEENIENQIRNLGKDGKRVYYITTANDTEILEKRLKMNIVFRAVDDTGENCEYNERLMFPFPVDVAREQTKISCYELRRRIH